MLIGCIKRTRCTTSEKQTTQDNHVEEQVEKVDFSSKRFDSLVIANAVDVDHAKKFGKLVIQDEGGRMKPMNTFSSELLRKISHKDSYKDFNSRPSHAIDDRKSYALVFSDL